MPALSKIESEALTAGEVCWEAELFLGNPDWSQLHVVKAPKLSNEKQAFLDGRCQELCVMVDNWAMNNEAADWPVDVWQFLRHINFFA